MGIPLSFLLNEMIRLYGGREGVESKAGTGGPLISEDRTVVHTHPACHRALSSGRCSLTLACSLHWKVSSWEGKEETPDSV